MDNRFKNNKNFDKVSNIIESLTINPNPDSVGVWKKLVQTLQLMKLEK